jgi:hypothetical protein
MLYSVDVSSYVDYVPHAKEYYFWRSRLPQEEFRAIWDDLSSRISGSEIQTSSWIPGADWSGTVFQPIFEKACDKDPIASAKFFGLILWDVVRSHEQTWGFGRYKLGDVPIEGMTYFRLRNPPTRK